MTETDNRQEQEWIGCKELGAILGIHRMTVSTLAEQGRIPAVNFGTTRKTMWRFNKAAVTVYLANLAASQQGQG